MVAAPSKLPLVHAKVVAPKLLRTVERSVRSTWPSALASPRSSGADKDGGGVDGHTAEGGFVEEGVVEEGEGDVGGGEGGGW